MCNSYDNSLVEPSLKVLHILKGLQKSSAKSNIKRVDLNLLRTFSMGDLQQWRIPNCQGKQSYFIFYSALKPSDSNWLRLLLPPQFIVSLEVVWSGNAKTGTKSSEVILAFFFKNIYIFLEYISKDKPQISTYLQLSLENGSATREKRKGRGTKHREGMRGRKGAGEVHEHRIDN